MSHNRAVKTVIGKIKEKVDGASSKSDLLSAVQLAIDFGSELRYRHTVNYSIAGTAAGLLALLFLIGTQAHNAQLPPETALITIVGCLGLAIIIPLGMVYFRKNSITSLSKDIAQKDAFFDNKLEALAHTTPVALDLIRSFVEFERGNHSRQIQRLVGTTPDASNKFKYYEFEYVDKRTRTVTESDGKGGTKTRVETTYHHYYRYGLVLDFPYVKSLALTSNGKCPNKCHYTPAHIEFNEEFQVSAETDLAAAQFLKPAVVLAIWEASNEFERLNIEINSAGQMCISFDDKDVITQETEYDLREPQAFADELSGHAELTKLNLLTALLATLERHSDDN